MTTMIIDEMREGTAAIKKGKGTSLTFTSSWNFLVLADSPTTSREEVLLGTPGLPVVGLNYGLINAICTGISAKREPKNALYWHVTTEFDTGREDQRQNPSDPDNPDPTTWIPVFVIDSFETKQRILTVDKSPASASGPKTCTNSANQPFGEPLTETVTLCSYTFTQFEDPMQDINTILDRNDTVNSLQFANRDARTLKLNVTSAELGYYGSFNAWRIGYKVTYDRDTWDVKMLDVGPNQLDAAGTGLVPCKDKENMFRVIGNLDGNGRQQSPNLDPYVITFRTYTEIDFNTFIRV